MENEIIKAGEIVKEIISFIRDTRNKYNIPKDKLTLYIDMQTKPADEMDLQILSCEGVITKFNMGNLSKIEYSLFELFEGDTYFESTNIGGYNIYISLPGIQKQDQVNDFNSEVERLKLQKIKYQSKLSDDRFILKAPQDIVDIERKKLYDAEVRIQNLKANLLMLNCGKEYYDLLLKLGSNEWITYMVQYQREIVSINEIYTQPWFDEIYSEMSPIEIKLLHDKIYDFQIW